jgi:hypothetical protein
MAIITIRLAFGWFAIRAEMTGRTVLEIMAPYRGDCAKEQRQIPELVPCS